MNWLLLWKGVLLFTLFSYSILVAVVFFGGIKNIVAMLKDLRESSQTPENNAQ
jgi:hypothetical protein